MPYVESLFSKEWVKKNVSFVKDQMMNFGERISPLLAIHLNSMDESERGCDQDVWLGNVLVLRIVSIPLR